MCVRACGLSRECKSMNLFLCVCVSVGNATGPYFPRARGSAGFGLALSKQFDSPVYRLGPSGFLLRLQCPRLKDQIKF